MTSTMNDLLSMSSHHNLICTKLKWSTISILMALLLIIIYATSGFYTLIDLTTPMSNESHTGNETIFWSIFSSRIPSLLSYLLLPIYFTTVLLTIILLCGIQFNKPWLLFLWTILMIIMLLLDGITTILALQQYQQRMHRTSIQVKILFIIMLARLILSICGIFITIFHFRYLSKAKSDHLIRKRMLSRYNNESASTSYNKTWTCSVGLLNPSKELNDDYFMPNIPQTITLPRANLATIQRRPNSLFFQPRNFHNKQSDTSDPVLEDPLNNDECNEDLPLTTTPLKDQETNIENI